MSISSTTNRISYTGNGAVDTYPYTFKIFSDSDLLVTVRNTSDVETTLALTTDYTVTGAGDLSGGNVVLVNSSQAWLDVDGDLKTDYVLVIRRKRTLLQSTDIRNQGTFYPEEIENEFDRQIMIDQQQQNEIDRSLKLPETVASADFDMTLPGDMLDSADKVPMVNSAGDGWAAAASWPSASSIAGAQAQATAAAASATAAASSASSASTSAAAAAASATSAATIVNSAFFRDVVYITNADSPFTVSSAHNGKLISCDTSSAAITINLPQISGLTLPFNVSFVMPSASNNVTINRAGTDTIGGATSKTISTAGAGYQLAADTDGTPDNWGCLTFGEIADLSVTTAKIGAKAVTSAKLEDGLVQSAAADIKNHAIAASVASNILTVAIKTAAGTDPSATDIVKIAFRSSTATTGTYTVRSVTAALSVDVVSGASLGLKDGQQQDVHLYAIDNAGTVELAVAGSRIFDEGTIQSTTAIDTSSDSASVLYSTTARANVPIRYIGRVRSTQTTYGTWAAAPSELALFTGDQERVLRSEVWLTGGNGHGATNTKIRRFTTTVRNVGTAITYADSANNGASFTINEDGVYMVTYSDSYGAGSSDMGLSINSTELTTDITSITNADRLLCWVSANSNFTATGSVQVTARKGDVIRAHTTALVNQTVDQRTTFKITHIGK